MQDAPSDHRETPTPVERLFRELAPALITWASLRLSPSVRHHVSPEDLAQEVWVRAIHIYDRSFDAARMSARSWLFAVAKNVLLEVQRAVGRLRAEQGADGHTTRCRALAEVPESVTSFTERIARGDAVKNFLSRAAELDEDDRRLLIHRGFEELPLHQVAALLGIQIDAATKRWQRLRSRIGQWPVGDDLLVG
jgi:RNA polymerase sigma factor (sigma-70 family)